MRCHREGRARDFRARGWWSAETIDQLVRERVGADPEGLALVDPPNTTALVGRDPVRWSWNRLNERVDVLAAFLLARGVRAGDVVAVQLPNCSALVQAFLAIVRIGAIVTPFPVSYREHEMGPMCRRTGAVGVITSSGYGGRELAGAALGLNAVAPSVRFVVARGDDEPAGALPWPEAPLTPTEQSTLDSHVASLDVDVNDCVTICWTSGTEAEPKAVPRCHGDWLTTAAGCAQAAGLTAEDVLLSPFPMTNMAGIGGMFLPWLQTGAVFVPHHPFDLPVFLSQLASERVTYTLAPPALLTMLLHERAIFPQWTSRRCARSAPARRRCRLAWCARGRERTGSRSSTSSAPTRAPRCFGDPIECRTPSCAASFFPNYGCRLPLVEHPTG